MSGRLNLQNEIKEFLASEEYKSWQKQKNLLLSKAKNIIEDIFKLNVLENYNNTRFKEISELKIPFIDRGTWGNLSQSSIFKNNDKEAEKKFKILKEHIERNKGDYFGAFVFELKNFQATVLSSFLFLLDWKAFPIINHGVVRALNNLLATNHQVVGRAITTDFLKDIKKIKDDYFKDPNMDWSDVCYFLHHLGTQIRKEEIEKDEITENKDLDKIETSPSKEVKASEVNITQNVRAEEIKMYTLDQPDKKTIKQIITFVNDGDIAIPNFQRYFRWDAKDIDDLFESIFRGYYIGSLLFWRTDTKLDLDIIPISGSKKKKEELKPRYIILDGQQRISSLYYVIESPDEPLYSTRYPYVFFVNLKALLYENESDSDLIVTKPKPDAQNKKLFDNKVLFQNWLFPLNQLKNFYSWLDDFETYLEDEEKILRDKAREIKANIRERLNYVWDKFDIPIIILPEDMHLEHVAEIFERLNSRGISLTVFDLLNARLLKYDIKLRDLWESTCEKYTQIKSWGEGNEKVPVHILQVITLSNKGACKRKDLLEIDNEVKDKKLNAIEFKKKFENDWEIACEYLDKALTRLYNLREGFGVIHRKWIPYDPMISVMAALLKEIEDRKDRANCLKKISMWYWASVFSNAYEGSIDSRMAQDFREVKRWFSAGEFPETVKIIQNSLQDPNWTVKQIDRASNSIYKGIMCLVAMEGAKDFKQGEPLEFNLLDDHHIFPYSRADEYNAKQTINSVLNKTLIAALTNKEISNTEPSKYLDRFMKDQKISIDEMFQRLKTHLISREAFEKMLVNDFNGFLIEREKTVKEKIKSIFLI